MIIGVVVIALFLYKKPYLSLPIFFAANFAQTILLPNAQVRLISTIQIIVIAFCCIVTNISRRHDQDEYNIPIKLNQMRYAPIIIFLVCLVESINGIVQGADLFSVAVDAYEYIEILLYIFLIRYTLRTTSEMHKTFSVLMMELLVFGLHDLIYMDRGGVSLNLTIHFSFIVIACGMYRKKKYYWPLVIYAILIVFFAKSRTYMVAAIVGFLFVFSFSNGKRKSLVALQYIGVAIALISIGVNVLVYTGNTAIVNTIDRILQVKELGFDSGGYRIYEMRYALQKFLEKPLLGVGFGYREMVTLPLMGTYEFGGFLHVSYAGILMKVGILGGLLFMFGMIRYIRYQISALRANREDEFDIISYVMLGGITGTVSWLMVYLAAPYTSYGHMFIPGIFSLLYFELYNREVRYGIDPVELI